MKPSYSCSFSKIVVMCVVMLQALPLHASQPKNKIIRPATPTERKNLDESTPPIVRNFSEPLLSYLIVHPFQLQLQPLLGPSGSIDGDLKRSMAFHTLKTLSDNPSIISPIIITPSGQMISPFVEYGDIFFINKEEKDAKEAKDEKRISKFAKRLPSPIVTNRSSQIVIGNESTIHPFVQSPSE
jgi:hypothetical protein